MDELTELEKIEQAQEYFVRFYEFEEAIKVNKENRIYLKKYIHDEEYVDEEFDLKSKATRLIVTSVVVGVVVFLLLWLMVGSSFILPAIISGVVIAVALSVASVSVQSFRLTQAKENQLEVNKGINEQIVILTAKDEQLIKQKDDYYKALQNRIPYFNLEYMNYIDQIKCYIENGDAKTCQQATEILEQSLLMEQMSSLMQNNDVIAENTEQEDKERFCDPVKMFGKKKRKLLKPAN